MKNFIKYLIYLYKHKKFVYKAGRKIGVGRWQLLMHDLSKFRPSEFFAYKNYFYGGNQTYYENDFDRAWNLHLHRNKHHWQYWILVNHNSGSEIVPLRIPNKYVREMVADWIGTGWNITGDEKNCIQWYQERRSQIILHPKTKKLIQEIMDKYYGN